MLANIQLFIDNHQFLIHYLVGLIGIMICIYYYAKISGEKFSHKHWLIVVLLGALLGWIIFLIGLFVLLLVALCNLIGNTRDDIIVTGRCPYEDIQCPYVNSNKEMIKDCKQCGLEV